MPLNKFDRLFDLLRFKIYSGNPHSSILSFLSENFPYLVTQPEQGGWTIYPPGLVEAPKMIKRSLQLALHPFIEIEHNGTKIEFLTQVWATSPPGISQIRVWIYFNTRALAKAAQTHLVEQFLNIGANVKWMTHNNEIKATVYKDVEMDELDSVSFILKEDPEKFFSLLVLFWDDKGDVWQLDYA